MEELRWFSFVLMTASIFIFYLVISFVASNSILKQFKYTRARAGRPLPLVDQQMYKFMYILSWVPVINCLMFLIGLALWLVVNAPDFAPGRRFKEFWQSFSK